MCKRFSSVQRRGFSSDSNVCCLSSEWISWYSTSIFQWVLDIRKQLWLFGNYRATRMSQDQHRNEIVKLRKLVSQSKQNLRTGWRSMNIGLHFLSFRRRFCFAVHSNMSRLWVWRYAFSDIISEAVCSLYVHCHDIGMCPRRSICLMFIVNLRMMHRTQYLCWHYQCSNDPASCFKARKRVARNRWHVMSRRFQGHRGSRKSLNKMILLCFTGDTCACTYGYHAFSSFSYVVLLSPWVISEFILVLFNSFWLPLFVSAWVHNAGASCLIY